MKSVYSLYGKIQIYPQGDYIIAYCKRLEISSYGLTNAEAIEGCLGLCSNRLSATNVTTPKARQNPK